MIPFFFSDCKVFSGERVKNFWKNRGKFLKKFFLDFCGFGFMQVLMADHKYELYFYTFFALIIKMSPKSL
ncbi:hypothetical protein D3Z55_21140 [Clostridiaceae bacterium]|nr:hypothetical protein [Clostridiaceae bacterium]